MIKKLEKIMLDFTSHKEIENPVTEIPGNFLAALEGQTPETLALIEADIEFFERTGIIKGRALALIKSLQTETCNQKTSRHVRPQMLAA